MAHEGAEIIPFPNPLDSDFEQFVLQVVHDAIHARTESWQEQIDSAKNRHPSSRNKKIGRGGLYLVQSD